MKFLIYVFGIIFLFVACSVSNTKQEEKACSKTYKNDFKRIVYVQFSKSITKDSLQLTEARFECINTSFAIKKGLYDTYGVWDKAIYVQGQKHPILIWNNRMLFAGQIEQYNIAAYGAEKKNTVYASAMVFNNSGEDMLSSSENKKIINKLSQLIKDNDSKKRDFYEAYWTEVDPNAWERMKKM
ncbi:hypothetical protein GCM10011344_23090 [Dokdonia pacifica]|uniref:Lipoprotein n=1 Tax=Dokdonia pacifica TaxID=1627892 RepID=A0A238WJG3_9FLAO|nr:hypothetical protein [Dokdonia pacifica]GGG21674.1 hypothetical protein GCM10011344_23090 [Dokdonia pacifica]SNR46627.1 hypothetical protein SAMN06265376_1011139 [Dokdonia pacifica]